MRKSMLAGLLALTLLLSGCGGKGNGAASGSNGSASGAEPAGIPTAEEIQAVRETLEGAVVQTAASRPPQRASRETKRRMT